VLASAVAVYPFYKRSLPAAVGLWILDTLCAAVDVLQLQDQVWAVVMLLVWSLGEVRLGHSQPMHVVQRPHLTLPISLRRFTQISLIGTTPSQGRSHLSSRLAAPQSSSSSSSSSSSPSSRGSSRLASCFPQRPHQLPVDRLTSGQQGCCHWDANAGRHAGRQACVSSTTRWPLLS